MAQWLSRHKLVILYGACLAGILLLMKWLEFRFVVLDHGFEVYIGAIALIFTGLGIWLAIKLGKPKIHTVVVEKQVLVTPPTAGNAPDEKTLAQIGISKREWEVLAPDGRRTEQPGNCRPAFCIAEYH